MKDELISSISNILTEWNPLGEKSSTITDLEGYKYEAMDILSSIEITKGYPRLYCYKRANLAILDTSHLDPFRENPNEAVEKRYW